MNTDIIVGVLLGAPVLALVQFLLTWWRDRGQVTVQAEIGVTDVAARYWTRIDALELRVAELIQEVSNLKIELAKRTGENARLQAELIMHKGGANGSSPRA